MFNDDRIKIIEELYFIKEKLIEKDTNVEILLSREINNINVTFYVGHIIEVNESLMYSYV